MLSHYLVVSDEVSSNPEFRKAVFANGRTMGVQAARNTQFHCYSYDSDTEPKHRGTYHLIHLKNKGMTLDVPEFPGVLRTTRASFGIALGKTTLERDVNLLHDLITVRDTLASKGYHGNFLPRNYFNPVFDCNQSHKEILSPLIGLTPEYLISNPHVLPTIRQNFREHYANISLNNKGPLKTDIVLCQVYNIVTPTKEEVFQIAKDFSI